MLGARLLRRRGGAAELWTLANLAAPPDWWCQPETILGGAFAEWSGVGSRPDWSESTVSQQPTYPTNQINGYAVARFDGSNDTITAGGQTGFFRNKAVGWAAFVFKRAALDGAATWRTLLYNGTNANGTSRFAVHSGSGATGGANKLVLSTRRLDAEAGVTLTTPAAIADTGYHIVLVVRDWAATYGAVWVDGVKVIEDSSHGTAGNTSDTNTLQVPHLGAFRGGGGPVLCHNGDIVEWCVHNAAIPSNADIDRIFGYLAHKYALTALLPGGHPYKTVAPTV